jgi:hypothetical protein
MINIVNYNFLLTPPPNACNLYFKAQLEQYFWTGGNALKYLSKRAGKDVPSQEWYWIGSGRVIDLPKEFWGTDHKDSYNQPDRRFDGESDSYQSCIVIDSKYSDIHDLFCHEPLRVLCQKIE